MKNNLDYFCTVPRTGGKIPLLKPYPWKSESDLDWMKNDNVLKVRKLVYNLNLTQTSKMLWNLKDGGVFSIYTKLNGYKLPICSRLV